MIATIIIGICLLAVVAFIVKKMISDKLKGKNSCSCGGNCGTCGSKCKTISTAQKIKEKKLDD